MNNLKRVLSLGLAGTMLSGLMLTGAGAVGTKDFTDVNDIDHSEAVNTMVSLNIINGKDDGSFAPEETVTRAQMAKMITIALHGGKEPVLGTKTIPTYTDIGNHWAESYIEYCSSQKIISGQGDGTFNPDGSVTGSQAAKMVLTAMGYDATVFNFTGVDWEINVNGVANKPENDLYEDLDGLNPAEPLSRDNAAQLIYNGLQAETMQMDPNMSITNGEITYQYKKSGKTLLKEKYNVDVYEGVLMATGEYDLTGRLETNSSDAANKDGFVVDVDAVNSKSREQANIHGEYFKAKDTDLTEYMGQYVKVLYNDSKDILFGVYPVVKKNSVVVTDVTKVSYPSNETNKVKIDGELYPYETGSSTLTFIKDMGAGSRTDTYNDLSNSTATDRVFADKVTFIDNDGNGKFDVALVHTMGVAEITFMSSTAVTLSNQSSARGTLGTMKTLSPKLEDIIYPDDLAKGDYVVTTRNFYANKDELTKVEKVTGAKVSGVKVSGNALNRGASTYTDFQVEDGWFTVATGYTMPTTIKSGSTMDYVAVNGVIYYAKLTSAATGSKDVAVIYDMSYGAAGTFGADTLQAKIILADGTKKTVTVAKLFSDINGVNYADKDGSLDDAEEAFIGQLLTYKVNNDGEYEFTVLTANNKAGYDSYNYAAPVTAQLKDNTIGGKIVDDNATIFLYAVDKKNSDNFYAPVQGTGLASIADTTLQAASTDPAKAVKVISGKEFKSIMDAADGAITYDRFINTAVSSSLVGRDADGFDRVRVACVPVIANDSTSSTKYGYDMTSAVDDWDLGVFTGSNYGYLVTSSWTEDVDGTAYNVYKFWNGSETVTMREKDSVDAKLPARTVIAYDVVDDQTIKNVTTSGISTGAVQAYSASASKVTLGNSSPASGVEKKITNQTVILNVNDADKQGVEGNSISLASSINVPGTDTVAAYIENCYYRFTGDEVDVIVIDVNKNALNSVAGLATTESPLILTDGVGVNNATMKIGVPAATSLAAGNLAAVQSHVASLFTNEVTVTIGTSGGNCATAVVTGPDGVGVTYSLVAAFNTTNVTKATIEAITNNTTTSQGWSTYNDMKTALTMMTAANGVESFKITDNAGTELADANMNTDYSNAQVVITALNGDTVTITGVTLDLVA